MFLLGPGIVVKERGLVLPSRQRLGDDLTAKMGKPLHTDVNPANMAL